MLDNWWMPCHTARGCVTDRKRGVTQIWACANHLPHVKPCYLCSSSIIHCSTTLSWSINWSHVRPLRIHSSSFLSSHGLLRSSSPLRAPFFLLWGKRPLWRKSSDQTIPRSHSRWWTKPQRNIFGSHARGIWFHPHAWPTYGWWGWFQGKHCWACAVREFQNYGRCQEYLDHFLELSVRGCKQVSMLQLTAICMYYGQFSNYLLIHQYSTIKALVKVLIDNLTAYITYQITSLFSLDIFFDQAVLILQKNTGSTGPHFKWLVLICNWLWVEHCWRDWQTFYGSRYCPAQITQPRFIEKPRTYSKCILHSIIFHGSK